MHEYPLVKIAFALMVGIVAADVAGISYVYWEAAMALSAIGITLLHFGKKEVTKGWQQTKLFLGFFVLFGGWNYTYHQSFKPVNHYSNFLEKEGYSKFVGIVLESPLIRNRARTTLEVQALQTDPKDWKQVEGKLLVYFNAEDPQAMVRPGDLVVCNARINPTIDNSNPYSFNYKKFLHNRGIDYQALVYPDNYKIIDSAAMSPPMQIVSDMRMAAVSRLEHYLPETNVQAVVSAMVLGYRNNVTPELYQSFTDTGVVHILAVSGLHVGVIAALLFFLLKRIPDSSSLIKVAKTAFIIMALIFYAMITGAAPAVVRAVVMFSLVLVGVYSSGVYSIYNTLATAAICMLAYDPSMFYQASFQFSFLALTSIVFFQPKLLRIGQPKNKLLNYAYQLALVAIAAQILVFPVTIYYFHKFPTYFMLTGILAIPAATFILYSGLLILVLDLLRLTILAEGWAWVTTWVVKLFNRWIMWVQEFPGSVVSGIFIEQDLMILMYVVIIAVMVALVIRHPYPALQVAGYTLICITLIISARLIKYTNRTLVTVYEIYNGYAIDIFSGRNAHTYQSPDLSMTKLGFAVDNNRAKQRVRNTFNLVNNQTTDKSGFAYYKGLWLDRTYSIYISDTSSLPDIHLDALILTNYSELTPDDIGEKIPDLILSDKSIDLKLHKDWKAYCQIMDIPYQSVWEQGAISVDLSDIK